MILRDKSVYLSPKLMEDLRNKTNNSLDNPYKSEIWSIGLTILEFGSLSKIDDCYNWNDYTISFTRIQDYLTILGSRYSYSFCRIIKYMLEEDENLRPDFNFLIN